MGDCCWFKSDCRVDYNQSNTVKNMFPPKWSCWQLTKIISYIKIICSHQLGMLSSTYRQHHHWTKMLWRKEVKLIDLIWLGWSTKKYLMMKYFSETRSWREHVIVMTEIFVMKLQVTSIIIFIYYHWLWHQFTYSFKHYFKIRKKKLCCCCCCNKLCVGVSINDCFLD